MWEVPPHFLRLGPGLCKGGEGELRGGHASMSLCSWTGGVTSCPKSLLQLPPNGGLRPGTGSLANPFLPHIALCRGICHSHRNEPRTRVHGWTNTVKIIQPALGMLLSGRALDEALVLISALKA